MGSIDPVKYPFQLVIHGGAGAILRPSDPTEAADKSVPYIVALRAALQVGYDVLAHGGTSVDAVVAAVVSMEDEPLFNAGRGAVFNSAGQHELEASVMRGSDCAVGAVTGIKHVRNPVELASTILKTHKQHCMLSGEGAEEYARSHGLQMVDNSWFSTDARATALKLAQSKMNDAVLLDHTGQSVVDQQLNQYDAKGTVGAVALDQYGNLAAATSTGGMTNKAVGRMGDSAIIGAGTYAENATAAISTTGSGEHIMRSALAYDTCARIKYAQLSLHEASQQALDRMASIGAAMALDATAGFVAIDRNGNIAMPFNSTGMYRGHVDSTGKMATAVWSEQLK